jgi:hypothetical protein
MDKKEGLGIPRQLGVPLICEIATDDPDRSTLVERQSTNIHLKRIKP